ncbi:MAG: AAA family ATPase, partial [Candidatus Hydrogenedens sp.]|nr:AAA family ATPase [Candidatus Hydrogenedens sp.]
FLSYEDAAVILAKRIQAVAAHYRLDRENLGAVLRDNLHLLDRPRPLAEMDRSKNVIPTPFYSELLEEARRMRPSMIVVDHLRSAGGGLNGSDPAAMGVVLGLLGELAKESGAAVLVLAHLKKGADADPDPGNVRGASSVTDEARGAWEIRRTGSDVTLTRTKSNHAQEGVSVKLRLVESAGSVCLETAGPVFRDPEMLIPEVVAWFKANPAAHVNPSGVLNGRGRNATDLLASVNAVHPWARPTDITAAIKSMISSGRLSVQTTRTPDRHTTETLALDPDFSEAFDDDDTPF